MDRALPCGDLVTHLGHDIRRRADEPHAGLGRSTGKVGPLREETIAGMDGVDVLLNSKADNTRNIQIGFDGGLALSDFVGLVHLRPVETVAVSVGVDGNRGNVLKTIYRKRRERN